MADYRQFCYECHNMLGFGSTHAPGCQVPVREAAYDKARHEKEQIVYQRKRKRHDLVADNWGRGLTRDERTWHDPYGNRLTVEVLEFKDQGQVVSIDGVWLSRRQVDEIINILMMIDVEDMEGFVDGPNYHFPLTEPVEPATM